MDAILLKQDIQKRTNDLYNPPKSKVICLTKMHYISKNWELVFYFQYKVTIGQCEAKGGTPTILK